MVPLGGWPLIVFLGSGILERTMMGSPWCRTRTTNPLAWTRTISPLFRTRKGSPSLS